jgi:hypothetical protein
VKDDGGIILRLGENRGKNYMQSVEIVFPLSIKHHQYTKW